MALPSPNSTSTSVFRRNSKHNLHIDKSLSLRIVSEAMELLPGDSFFLKTSSFTQPVKYVASTNEPYLNAKEGLFHFLPGYGTKLPLTGAILCHSQAKNNASWYKFQGDCYYDSAEAFWLQVESVCVRKTLLSISLFTLHRFPWNPDKHWGCERWRVLVHSSPLFTTLHHSSPYCKVRPSLMTGTSHNRWLVLVIIDDRTIVYIMRFKKKWWGWRVVKSGEESAQLFTIINGWYTIFSSIMVKSEEYFWK